MARSCALLRAGSAAPSIHPSARPAVHPSKPARVGGSPSSSSRRRRIGQHLELALSFVSISVCVCVCVLREREREREREALCLLCSALDAHRARATSSRRVFVFEEHQNTHPSIHPSSQWSPKPETERDRRALSTPHIERDSQSPQQPTIRGINTHKYIDKRHDFRKYRKAHLGGEGGKTNNNNNYYYYYHHSCVSGQARLVRGCDKDAKQKRPPHPLLICTKTYALFSSLNSRFN